MEKKTKYDTNPLDPDFPRRTEEVARGTEEVAHAEGERTQTLESEAPTRRIDAPYSGPTSYPSVFVPPTAVPPVAQGIPFTPPATIQQPTSRNIPGISLPENVVLILPYLPFFVLSIAVAAIELYLVPRNETRVRFHAAQGLALQLAVAAMQFLLSIFGNAFIGARVGNWVFSIAAFVFFIVSMIRVWKGEPHHIAPLDDATKWLNEAIEPRK
jgi:Chloroplast import component protein (Tic20).